MRLEDIDVERELAAIEADAEQKLPGLRESLQEAKEGKFAAIHTPEQLVIRAARKEAGMTQPVFAKMIHTPTATLRDWEQGRTNPPGTAVVLAKIVVDHPEVVDEYQNMTVRI